MQWHLSPCPFHIAVPPGCLLCGTTQNPSAHTYFNYLARESSAGRAYRPPWHSPTSPCQLCQLVTHPPCQLCQDTLYTESLGTTLEHTSPSAPAILPGKHQYGVPPELQLVSTTASASQSHQTHKVFTGGNHTQDYFFKFRKSSCST